jgi:hypothetical protein
MATSILALKKLDKEMLDKRLKLREKILKELDIRFKRAS